jgi:hypothetical protein
MSSSPNNPNRKGKAAILCQAATSYKKKGGNLVLSKTALIWNQQGSSNPDGELSFDAQRLNCMQRYIYLNARQR